MNDKKLRIMYRNLRGSSLSNENLFVLLRACENKSSICRNSFYKDLWNRRIARIKDAITTRNEGLVYSSLIRLGQLHDAEMTSEAYLAVARSIRCFDVNFGCKWTTYVTNSILRSLYRLYKRRKLPQQLTEVPDFAPEYDKPPEMVDTLKKALADNIADLTEQEIEVLKLRFFHGWKLKALAAKYNVTKQCIINWQRRACKKLKNAMQAA